jgi:hypothetical protein
MDLAERAEFARKRGQHLQEVQENVSALIAGRTELAGGRSRTHSRVYLLVF